MTDIGTLLTNAVPDLPDQPDRVRQVQRKVGRRRAVLGVSAAVLAIAAGVSLVPVLTAGPEVGGSDLAAGATPVCVAHLRNEHYEERPFTPDIPSGAIRATLCAQYPTPFKARPDLSPLDHGFTPEAERLLDEHHEAEARGRVLADPDGIIAKLNTMRPVPEGCSSDFDGVRNWIAFEYPEGPLVAVMLDYSCTFTNDSQSRKLTMPLEELVG